MKKNTAINLTPLLTIVFLFGLKREIYAQEIQVLKTNSNFFTRIQFGGGLGLSAGNGYADVVVAPSVIYNFNPFLSAGLGVQYNYVKQRNLYSANMYGGSLIALFNPMEELQISTELEQLRVDRTYSGASGNNSAGFWNTALFVGAGYRNENVTMGLRYNVLHKDRENLYTEAFMPFVRVLF
jgi:hypothetical protein